MEAGCLQVRWRTPQSPTGFTQALCPELRFWKTY